MPLFINIKQITYRIQFQKRKEEINKQEKIWSTLINSTARQGMLKERQMQRQKR